MTTVKNNKQTKQEQTKKQSNAIEVENTSKLVENLIKKLNELEQNKEMSYKKAEVYAKVMKLFGAFVSKFLVNNVAIYSTTLYIIDYNSFIKPILDKTKNNYKTNRQKIIAKLGGENIYRSKISNLNDLIQDVERGRLKEQNIVNKLKENAKFRMPYIETINLSDILKKIKNYKIVSKKLEEYQIKVLKKLYTFILEKK